MVRPVPCVTALLALSLRSTPTFDRLSKLKVCSPATRVCANAKNTASLAPANDSNTASVNRSGIFRPRRLILAGFFVSRLSCRSEYIDLNIAYEESRYRRRFGILGRRAHPNLALASPRGVERRHFPPVRGPDCCSGFSTVRSSSTREGFALQRAAGRTP